jgi:3-deoxy-7-phosphoheptulonate synthase
MKTGLTRVGSVFFGVCSAFVFRFLRRQNQKEEKKMIIVLKSTATKEQVEAFARQLEEENRVKTSVSRGRHSVVIGLEGDTSEMDMEAIEAKPLVESVTRIQEPYKKANRKFHPMDTVVEVGGVRIGGRALTVIAGPCSVETREQITEVARAVKASGAQILRGGAFKPRTSPYAFQGLGADGIDLLRHAREATGLPIVSEIMSADQLPLFADVDIIQVGARNMQNFALLKLLGKTDKPILLKRGLANTIEELLMSAEYIMAAGNDRVILCERGIRTFETMTRNTLDVSAVPLLKKVSHLPVIVDPSHAAGIAWMAEPLSMAGIAAGADGIMVEVHNNPPAALCDGAQSITPAQFSALAEKIQAVAPAFDREFSTCGK